ncbi:reverse transcriptase domain-containing protein [Tanacetum coccineum]
MLCSWEETQWRQHMEQTSRYENKHYYKQGITLDRDLVKNRCSWKKGKRRKHDRKNSDRQCVVSQLNQALKEKVSCWLKEGIITRVQYPEWIANAKLIMLANCTWQVQMDYSSLKKVCTKDMFPFPVEEEELASLMGYRYKCFLWLPKDESQIRIGEDDEEKTGFHTEGVYCFTHMPKGLKNSAATLQRMMEKVLPNQKRRNVELYLEEIVVKRKIEQSLVQDVEEMLIKLRRMNIQIDPNKSTFGVEEGKFLGYIITKEGIRADPEKIQAIVRSPTPKDPNQIQSLSLKLIAISKFIPKLAELMHHIREEALLARLVASTGKGMKDLHVFIDSQILVDQVEGNRIPTTEPEKRYSKELSSKYHSGIRYLYHKSLQGVSLIVTASFGWSGPKVCSGGLLQMSALDSPLTLGNATEDLILERSKDNQHFKSFWMLLLLLHATLHFSSLQMFHKSTCINSGILFTSMTLSTDSKWIKGRDSNSTWKSLEMSSRSALEYRVKTLMHFLLMKKLCQYLRDLVHTGKTYSLTDDDSTPPKKARKFKKPASPKLTTVSVSTEEPTGKSKRVKRPEKKTTKAPARGVVIRETPEIPMSKKKEKVDVTRGKGIELLSQVALTEDTQFEEV